MKKLILGSLLATTMIAGGFASSAMAEPAAPPAKHGEQKPEAHPADHKGGAHHKGPHKGPHGKKEGPHGPRHAMRMAEKLAAMETAIGIRSDQLDVWRKYTSSLTDMTDVKPPKPGEKPADSKDAPIFGERMADMTIERADKAKNFKAAATELRKVLDAEQLKKLQSYSMHPEPMMHDAMPKPEPK